MIAAEDGTTEPPLAQHERLRDRLTAPHGPVPVRLVPDESLRHCALPGSEARALLLAVGDGGMRDVDVAARAGGLDPERDPPEFTGVRVERDPRARLPPRRPLSIRVGPLACPVRRREVAATRFSAGVAGARAASRASGGLGSPYGRFGRAGDQAKGKNARTPHTIASQAPLPAPVGVHDVELVVAIEGDHLPVGRPGRVPSPSCVSLRRSLPSAFMTKIPGGGVDGRPMKAIFRPSGDQSGLPDAPAAGVRLRCPLPSGFINQISGSVAIPRKDNPPPVGRPGRVLSRAGLRVSLR